MTTPEPQGLTLTIRRPAFLQIKSLLVTVIVAFPLFVITLVGTLLAQTATRAASTAWNAVDYDDDAADRLSTAYHEALDAQAVWETLLQVSIPLLAVALIGLIVSEIVAKRASL